MDKKALSERDICTKFITPALRSAGWDDGADPRGSQCHRRPYNFVRGKLVSRGRGPTHRLHSPLQIWCGVGFYPRIMQRVKQCLPSVKDSWFELFRALSEKLFLHALGKFRLPTWLFGVQRRAFLPKPRSEVQWASWACTHLQTVWQRFAATYRVVGSRRR